jgi:hypothetical protein
VETTATAVAEWIAVVSAHIVETVRGDAGGHAMSGRALGDRRAFAQLIKRPAGISALLTPPRLQNETASKERD